MRFSLMEASGALGDLGTFIPLVVSLVVVCRLDLGSVFLFAGLYNIISGVLFNQPVPVQPMKAIAAVAIAETLSPGAIAAAGLGAGAVVFILGITGLVHTIERLVPRAVVRGIQLGVGLKLIIKGVAMVPSTSLTSFDGWVIATIAAAFILTTSRWSRFPSALMLFGSGLVMLLLNNPDIMGALHWGWDGLTPTIPTLVEWKKGLVRGALPQVPLTVLNSVIAVCALSADLYPNKGIGTRPMAVSVGLMNLLGCWFGAMPMCHGAGGLAGLHRYGARSGGSVVMLGAAKVSIAVALGSSAIVLLNAYPMSILGVLLAFAGAELALPARECISRDGFFLATLTAGGCLAFNTVFGVAAGITAAFILTLNRDSGRSS